MAAQAGRGNRVEANADNEYQVIRPQLPKGRITLNTVFLHGDVKARPFRVEDFRDMLARIGMLADVVALGAYQINHVWAVTFRSAEATKKMLAAGEQEVKGRRCLVIDPQDQQVELKLHWLLHGVDDEDVRTALAAYGKVTEITKERWRVQGVNDKGSTTRTVVLKMKTGIKLEDLPHQIRVAGELALLVAPGRPMQCLRCEGTGHVRRDCKVPRCSRCRRFGHMEAQCVRTYANVTGPTSVDAATELVMDVTEAEEAAQGTGDTLAAENAATSSVDAETKTPEQTAIDASPTLTEDAASLQPDAVQPSASSHEMMQVAETPGVSGSAKRSHDKAGEGDAPPATSSSEEPPLKTSQVRRTPFKPRAKNAKDRRVQDTSHVLQQPPGSSGEDGGVS